MRLIMNIIHTLSYVMMIAIEVSRQQPPPWPFPGRFGLATQGEHRSRHCANQVSIFQIL